jgi:hypothetical protein
VADLEAELLMGLPAALQQGVWKQVKLLPPHEKGLYSRSRGALMIRPVGFG